MALPKLWSKPFWGWYIVHTIVTPLLGASVLSSLNEYGFYPYYDDFGQYLLAVAVVGGIPLILLFAYSLIKSKE